MISVPNSPPLLLRINPSSIHFSPSLIYFKTSRTLLQARFRSLKTESDGDRVLKHDSYSPDLLKKPRISPLDEEEELTKSEKLSYEHEEKRDIDDWVDWEDQILEDTVPLVGFVRMILHSGKYGGGDRLSPEHEKTILERLLPYHPECKRKIGPGVDYIKVDYHPEFEDSRCLFIVRKDGNSVDFSYWKCIKGFIKKNYPLYADSFILRHFRRQPPPRNV